MSRSGRRKPNQAKEKQREMRKKRETMALPEVKSLRMGSRQSTRVSAMSSAPHAKFVFVMR